MSRRHNIVHDRREALARLTAAGVLTRSCPTQGMVEVFVQPGDGFDHWVEGEFTPQALAAFQPSA